MDQLLQEIENLEKQKTIFLGQLLTETSETTKQAFEQEIAAVERKLAEKSEQRERMKQQRQEIEESVMSEDSSFGIAIGGMEVNFRDFARDEESYQTLAIATQLKLQELEQDNQSEIAALKASFQAELAQERAKNEALIAENNQISLERKDFQEKWTSAANQVNELKVENDSLKDQNESYKSQVEELRSNIQKPSVPTNLDGIDKLKELKAIAESKRIPVYDVEDVFRPNAGTYTTFKFAETGEYGEVIWTAFNSKYRKVDAKEAARFQQEYKEKALVESTPITTAVEPEIAFPTPPTIPEHVLDGESAAEDAETVSVGESFEDEVRRRLTRVETVLGIAV